MWRYFTSICLERAVFFIKSLYVRIILNLRGLMKIDTISRKCHMRIPADMHHSYAIFIIPSHLSSIILGLFYYTMFACFFFSFSSPGRLHCWMLLNKWKTRFLPHRIAQEPCFMFHNFFNHQLFISVNLKENYISCWAMSVPLNVSGIVIVKIEF